MGAKHGAWCVGCCWALMASLFALGVMSVFWMVVVAVLIAVEKTLPWRRAATYGTAAVLLVLGVLRAGGAGRRAGADDPRRGIDGSDDGLGVGVGAALVRAGDEILRRGLVERRHVAHRA